MAVFAIKSFGGISPKTPARYLRDEQAQVAINCPVFSGSIQPLANVGSAVHTLTKSGVPQTIYRFGQDTKSDSLYWFHWTQDVDVCRSQISGDASEWTFYTGDGGPKATYNAIGLSGSNYPSVSRPLGLPAPSQAAWASSNAFTPNDHPAKVILTAEHISQLSTSYGILISTTTDDEAAYTTVTLTATDASAVTSAINTALSASLTATESLGAVTIETKTAGSSAKLFVKFQTGTTYNTDGTFSYDASPNLYDTGGANTDPYVVLLDSEIGSISSGDTIRVATNSGTHINDVAVSSTMSAGAFATWLTSRLSGAVVAVAYGSCVVLTPGSAGGGASGRIEYRRRSGASTITSLTSTGSESASPATLFVTQTHVDAMEGQYVSINVNGTESFVSVPSTAYVTNLASLSGYGVSVEVFGAVSPFAVIKTTAVGTSASLRIRTGAYPNTAVYSLQSSEGYSDDDETTETRVYTWTWVNKESGFEFESAPAEASNEVEVRTGQTVSLSGLPSVPGGDYVVTHRRIYRSTSGVFLYVGEIAAAEVTYTDSVEPDSLGEELATTTWSEPPANLQGLINLPNGLMAGFVKRDVYFCDPYHPHAWPLQYVQAIDFPVVGLGRMDTTLAVLTTGTPYFIQGTHPENMAVVKSDMEQACVSKRSIVSTGGAVVYASPDGLILLAPSGSRNLTQNLFNHTQWQSYFKPESIHAYQHDNMYVAFYDNDTTQGGFIYDLTSGQFILHDIYASAGYNDVQRDELFLAFSDRSVKKWMSGSVLSYRWKSKKFTMPQVMGFSCAQLEAEAYPMTMKVYADGTLAHTQTVNSRDPFRLPAVKGRDWEVQLEGSSEVFSLAVAQSMTELANG